jgi:glycopeptide antibiotics resistance protein
MKAHPFLRWIFFVAGLGLLLLISLIDMRPYVHVFIHNQDKLFHLLVFALLLGFSKKLVPAFSMRQSALFLVGFGLLIEILQKLITHGLRQFSFYDVLFNLMGISLGWLFFYAFGRIKLKQQGA